MYKITNYEASSSLSLMAQKIKFLNIKPRRHEPFVRIIAFFQRYTQAVK